MHDQDYSGQGKHNCSRPRTHEEVKQASYGDEKAAQTGLTSREPMKPRPMLGYYGMGYTSRG